MRVNNTLIADVLVLESDPDPDERGASTQLLNTGTFEAATGRPMFPVRQVFCGRSRRDVVRGMHFTAGGSEKIVFAMAGHLHDVLVDLREGSPTFGVSVAVQLTASATTAVYVPEGVGHGYWCLEDDSVLCYLLSNDYIAEREVSVDPFDPALALPWPDSDGHPIMSDRDRDAPSLERLRALGPLPSWGVDRPHRTKGSS